MENKTLGYTPSHERNNCEDCIYMEWKGDGSRKQQMTYCTRNEENGGEFMVGLEDICDEFESAAEYNLKYYSRKKFQTLFTSSDGPFDGDMWVDIDFERIKNPHLIKSYIDKGVLRIKV